VLDVGGGSGAWAVPLAGLGCVVNRRRLEPERPWPRCSGGPATRTWTISCTPSRATPTRSRTWSGRLGGTSCWAHGLLEIVDDPARSVAALAAAADAGAAVSVLTAGRYAAVLSRTLAGRLAEARALLTDPDGRFGPDDALRRRLGADALRALLEDGGLSVEVLQGDGVLEQWVPGATRDGGPSAARAVAELEELATGSSRYATSLRGCTPSPGIRRDGPRPQRVPAAPRGRVGGLPDGAAVRSPNRPSAAT
jgi:hypothetical protein